MGFYPNDHREANHLSKSEWDVPENYKDRFLDALPIKKSMLISAYSMSGFINRFHYNYVREKKFEEERTKDNLQFHENGFTGSPHVTDSILNYGIIKYTPDPLLRQMILTERFSQNLKHGNIDLIEENRNFIEEYITEPFLKEPLIDKYEKQKNFLENPKVSAKAIINELSESKASDIIKEILEKNTGKLIYIDFWGTWCGPCIAEMPNSKKLMSEYREEDAAFVYICVNSEEKNWKAKLSELQIDGQHYLLSDEQSKEIRNLFEIRGIPFYILYDKNGKMIDKGNHLRPKIAKGKIEELI